jgi:hypothetical protein
MNSGLSLYYNRDSGHGILKNILVQKKYNPYSSIGPLYENYKFQLEVAAKIAEIPDLLKIYHSIPLWGDEILDCLAISDKKVYLFINIFKPYKRVHVHGIYISAEEELDRTTLGKYALYKSYIMEKLSLNESQVVAVLTVHSSGLEVDAHKLPEVVTTIDSLFSEIVSQEKFELPSLDAYEIAKMIEDPSVWGIEQVNSLSSYNLYLSASPHFEGREFTNGTKRKRSRKKIISLSLVSIILGFFYQSNANYLNTKFSDVTGYRNNIVNMDNNIELINNTNPPKFERFVNPALCPDPTNCKVGDKTSNGDIIFYDAGTMENWGRYLVMSDYQYIRQIRKLTQTCDKSPINYSTYLDDYMGGDLIVHRVNNNMFITDLCPTLKDLLPASESDNLISNDYLIPSLYEAELLSLYIGLLSDPGFLDISKTKLLTSSMGEDGFKSSGASDGLDTIVLVRVAHE